MFSNNEFIYQHFLQHQYFKPCDFGCFVYAIRFNVPPRNMLIFLISFMYQALIFTWRLPIINWNFYSRCVYSFLRQSNSSWYYKTNHDRKIQISTTLVGSLYGLTVVLYILLIEITEH